MAQLISVIVDVLQKFWWVVTLASPLKFMVVEEGSHGVRFTWGRPGPSLEPGLHVATSGQILKSLHTRLCENAVDEISLTLRDGTPLRIDGVLTYRITDVGKFLTASEDTDWLLSEFAEAALQGTLSELDFAEFHREPRRLEARIRRDLQRQARRAGFGVTVKYFRVKKFRVVCPTTQSALAVNVLVDALRKIPDELAGTEGFGAKVALVAGAVASNVVNGPAETKRSLEAGAEARRETDGGQGVRLAS